MADQIINVNCGFFDSVNQDRLYSAEQMNKPYKRLISDGVFATPKGTPSTDLQVLANNENMIITVKKGDGVFAGKWFENPSDKTFTVPNNTSIASRIDSIIAQVDNTTNGRVGNLVYRTGEASATPQSPSINTNVSIKEYRIANIYVNAGATAINQSNVTDYRGSSECPWVTSLIQQVDLSELFTQYQDWFIERKQQAEEDFDDFEEEQETEFTNWFNRMKDQLSEDAAGNLQEQIDDIPNLIATAILEADMRKHPVGSLEFNVTGTNPVTYLGFGTWTQWGKGRMITGVNEEDENFDEAEKTGGGTIKDKLKVSSIDYALTRNTFNTETSGYGGQGLISITSNREHTPQTLDENGLDFKPAYITCHIWKRIN